MDRMYKCRVKHGEGETIFTGTARVERLAWAMPVAAPRVFISK